MSEEELSDLNDKDFKWAADLAKTMLTVDRLRGTHNLCRCFLKLYDDMIKEKS